MIGHFIYCFYDLDKTLLYVGKTTHLKNRLRSHFSPESIKQDSWKTTIDIFNIVVYNCNNGTDLDIYETYYINKYKPKYNKDKMFGEPSTFELPELQQFPFLEYTNEKMNLYNNVLNDKQKKILKKIFVADLPDYFTKYNSTTNLLEYSLEY